MLKPLKGIYRLFKILFILFVLSGVGLFLFATYLYFHFLSDLPKIEGINDYNPYVVSEVYDQEGIKIGEFWKECRFIVPYEKIPRLLIDAFVASEDARFWEHSGVDPQSIIRAFLENMRAGHIVQGGSTITQQVTRSLLLTRTRKLERKIKEALLATQIEQNLSKEQILYLYLNQIYLGNRAYGVQAAARNYFRKDVSELTLAESALLAGLPSAPSQYDPFVMSDKAKEVQRKVLGRMVSNRYISSLEADAAARQPLRIYKAMIDDADFNARGAPYFTENLRQYLLSRYGEEVLYQGGLRIESTANLRLSLEAQKAVKKGLRQVDQMQGFRGPVDSVPAAAIEESIAKIDEENLSSLDPPYTLLQDGTLQIAPEARRLSPDEIYKAVITEVRPGVLIVAVGRSPGVILRSESAWARYHFSVGDIIWVRKKTADPLNTNFEVSQEPLVEGALLSYDPASGKIRAMIGGYDYRRSEFNRTFQAKRQAGSAFKPFVYAAALDKGYRPGTPVMDSPVTFQLNVDEFYTPRNYGETFEGPMTLRTALARSINVVAVKVLYDIGVDYLAAYGYKLGLTTPIRKYISTALGASDTTLRDLAIAYGTFANEGVRPQLAMLERITNENGLVLEEYSSSPPVTQTPHPQSFLPDTHLNSDLFNEAGEVIKQYDLHLTNDELQILYGPKIPQGHVITPKTAYLITDLLTTVVQQGTGRRALELGRPVAGKTGTTNEDTDCWFIGYTPTHLAAVWVGFDGQKTLGDHMTGGAVASPIWVDYMKEAHKNQPILPFHKPDSIKAGNLDNETGGSTLFVKPITTPEANPSTKETPEGAPVSQPKNSDDSSRGIEFLFGD